MAEQAAQGPRGTVCVGALNGTTVKWLAAATPPRDNFTAFILRRRVDLLIVVTLLAASSIWATQFWNAWTARGGQPAFYQAISNPQLLNLPHLRVYAKAPFALALVMILGVLATSPVRRPIGNC